MNEIDCMTTRIKTALHGIRDRIKCKSEDEIRRLHVYTCNVVQDVMFVGDNGPISLQGRFNAKFNKHFSLDNISQLGLKFYLLQFTTKKLYLPF